MQTYPAARPYGTGSSSARVGVVRALNGVMVTDDVGSFNPLGTTLFPAWWLRRNDPSRFTANAAFAKECAIDYLRILCEVGGPTWEDRTIDPRVPEYESVLRDVVDEAYDVHGLRVELSIFGGGTGADPSMTVDKVLKAIDGRTHKVMNVEGVNEANANMAAMKPLVKRLTVALSPTLVAYASTDDPSLDDQMKIASAYTVHLDRNLGELRGEGAPLGERAIRQAWDLKDYGKPGFHNEPIGPQSSVAETSDARILAMLRWTAVLSGCVGFVFHTGGGVRCGGAADVARGRSANLYDVPRYAELAACLRALDGVVPPALPTWQQFNLGWANAPWSVDSIWVDQNVTHGVNRLYSADGGDGQLASVVVGVRQHAELTALRALGTVTVYDPASGTTLLSQRCDAGSVLRIEGTSPGYVLVASA